MVAIVTIAVVAYFNWDLIMPHPASPLVVEHVEEIVQEPQAAMETIEYSEELDTDSIGTEDSLVTDNASHLERQAAAEIIPEEVEPLPKEVRTIAAQNQYYIIAGCFRSEQKAEQYLADIKQNGYPNATIQGKTDQGLTRVCYAGFPNMTEAKVHLKEVIEKENKSLWIQRITD
jgi:cell division protein FtsN